MKFSQIAVVFLFVSFFAIEAHAASLGGYGVVTPTNALSSGASTYLDVIDKTNTLTAGVVRRAEIYRADNSWPIVRFKAWRSNGTNWDLVGESGAIDMSTYNTGTGRNNLQLPTPITVQAGDLIGFSISSGSKSVSLVSSGGFLGYRTGDVQSGSVAKSEFTNFNSHALVVRYYDDDLLTSITANSAYNDESKSVTIVGRNFQSGATVKLTKSGQSDINATNVVVGSSTSITADIDLTGKAAGLWTVVVTNTDTTTASFTNGFSVYSRGAIILGVGDSIAEGIPKYTGPEHGGPSGDPLSQPWPYLSEATTGVAFYNGGIGSTSSANTNSTIQALLTSKTPSKVYINIGVNDIGAAVSQSTYLSNMSAILTKVVNAGAELIVNQILPNAPQQLTTPVYNAALEKWAFDNNVKLAPTFQEMAHPTSTTIDYSLNAAYDMSCPMRHPTSTTIDYSLNVAYSSGDLFHPNVAGYARMGQLMSYAAVPTKKRTWGTTSYPTFSHESWKWFVLAGGATVTGNSDTGSMSLPQNATASSDVIAIQSGSKPIAITATTSAGTASISYRTSSTIFSKGNSGISWTSYTAPFTVASDQYIQVRLTGSSVSTATVDDLTMRWAPSTFTFSGPSSGSINSASTNFTVTPDNLYTGTVTITPSGGGLSTPTVLTFTDSATPQTFTITPTSAGPVTLTVTNNSTLTNPAPLTYTASAVVPGAPTSVSATGGNQQAVVSFTAPVSDGGATITGYTATSSPGGIVATGTSSPLVVSGLTNGISYTFTVTATNSVGTSSASSASNSVTPADTGAPTLTEITPIASSTTDTTPDYTFASDEAGTITYGGGCTSSTTTALVGSNTITFNALAPGTYTACNITVTDGASNASSPLTVSAFVIQNDAPQTKTIGSIPRRGVGSHSRRPAGSQRL
jgi:lysophospholipase L1-like esterase